MFQKLSPAVKVGAGIITYLGSIASIIAAIPIIHPFTNFNSNVVSHWESHYSYPITGGR